MSAVNRNKPKRAASSESQYTVWDLEREFPDDATCLEWLWRRHFSADGSHAHCPKCDTVRKFHRVASRPSFSCDTCGQHLHPTAGTIFHKSSTSLALWFKAIFLMSSTRCGISAKQLERDLGVTYKTAWRMFTLIRRELMAQDDTPLSGEVEADETYVGGKPRAADRARWKREGQSAYRTAAGKHGKLEKAVVFGVAQRKGQVRAVVVPDNKSATLLPHLQKRVLPESTVYTDEASMYHPLTSRGYEHKRVHHSQAIYVDGDVHTNTIEGFWALVKGGLRGVHHSVSAKYLQGYLDEYAWRYNHRDDRAPMFFTLLDNIVPAR